MKEYREDKCGKCGVVDLMSPSRFVSKRCRKCAASNQKEWRERSDYTKNKAKITANKSQRNLRKSILEHYSGSVPARCVQCGEQRYQCLELDHINNDGAAHGKLLCNSDGYRAYRGVNSYIYRDIRKRNYPEGFQTLCSNCHSIKTKGEHYGSKEYFEGK